MRREGSRCEKTEAPIEKPIAAPCSTPLSAPVSLVHPEAPLAFMRKSPCESGLALARSAGRCTLGRLFGLRVAARPPMGAECLYCCMPYPFALVQVIFRTSPDPWVCVHNDWQVLAALALKQQLTSCHGTSPTKIRLSSKLPARESTAYPNPALRPWAEGYAAAV